MDLAPEPDVDLHQLAAMMARAEALAEQARALTDPSRPAIVRMWHARRAWRLLEEAQDLLDRVNVVRGHPIVRPPQKRLGMGRTGWMCAQWAVGIYNAYTAIMSIYNGHWVVAAISVLCVLVTADWILPRKPFNYRKPPTYE